MIVREKTRMYDRDSFNKAFNGMVCPDPESARYAERISEDETAYVAAYAAYFWTKHSPDKALIEDSFESLLCSAMKCEGGNVVKDFLVSLLVWKYNPVKWWSIFRSSTSLRDVCIKAEATIAAKDVAFEDGDFTVVNWGLHEHDHIEKFFKIFENLASTK